MLFFVHLRLRTESAHRETVTPELVTLQIQHIHELLASGIVSNAWRRIEGVAIVMLMESTSEVDCRAILDALPFSQAGVNDIELVAQVEPYLDVYRDPLRD
jgi:hypothetical protein